MTSKESLQKQIDELLLQAETASVSEYADIVERVAELREQLVSK